MPNWTTNVIAFKGKEESILKMLNDGLLNSGADKCETIADAIESVKENGKHKTAANGEITLEDGVTLRTFAPTPDTFLLYDTTNRPSDYEDAVEEQKKTYGVVGWYDYNLATLGTKWDAELYFDDVECADGVATMYITCDTAWSAPIAWINRIAKKYGLKSFILAKEEGGFFYYYGESSANGEHVDLLEKQQSLYEKFVTEDGEGYEDYYDADAQLWEDAQSDFVDYVNTH